MALLYISIVIFTVMQSATTKFYVRKSDNSVFFNALKTLSALILMCLINAGKIQFDKITFILAMAYGISLCLSMYSGYKALHLGPMSLTSLICSFAVIIPILYGIIFYNEAVTAYKITGICFLVLAIILININSANKTKTKVNFKWAMFVAITFITNGLCSVIQKKHQSIYPGEYAEDFMIFAMLLCAAVYVIISIKKFPLKQLWTSKGKVYGVLSGVSNALANYLTLCLVGMENASVLFPVISAGTIFTTVICGITVFKERLKINQIIAIVCGIFAIVFLKL